MQNGTHMGPSNLHTIYFTNKKELVGHEMSLLVGSSAPCGEFMDRETVYTHVGSVGTATAVVTTSLSVTSLTKGGAVVCDVMRVTLSIFLHPLVDLPCSSSAMSSNPLENTPSSSVRGHLPLAPVQGWRDTGLVARLHSRLGRPLASRQATLRCWTPWLQDTLHCKVEQCKQH